MSKNPLSFTLSLNVYEITSNLRFKWISTTIKEVVTLCNRLFKSTISGQSSHRSLLNFFFSKPFQSISLAFLKQTQTLLRQYNYTFVSFEVPYTPYPLIADTYILPSQDQTFCNYVSYCGSYSKWASRSEKISIVYLWSLTNLKKGENKCWFVNIGKAEIKFVLEIGWGWNLIIDHLNIGNVRIL